VSEDSVEKLGPISQYLTEDISSVRERERSAFEQVLGAHHNRVVVFGCGGLGRRAIERLAELRVRPLAFCDNNQLLWGTEVLGVKVLSVAEAAAQFGGDALFLIAVWNPDHWYYETAEQLKTAGARSIVSFLPLFWRFPDSLLPFPYLNAIPSRVYEAVDDVLVVEKFWRDDLSLDIYRANILWRALGRPEFMPPRPQENTYFPADIFSLASDECLVDCGAYNGDTVRMFLNRHTNFTAIYCIEGEATAFERMVEYLATLRPDIGHKIHPLHCAVGAARGIVRFDLDGVTGAKIDTQHAKVEVECYPMDELQIDRATIIKMDIEGTEYDALLGARRMILRDKPILAICVYHTQDDIWRIPLLIHNFLPEHKLFLRAYEGDGFQTVLYAVPPDRALI